MRSETPAQHNKEASDRQKLPLVVLGHLIMTIVPMTARPLRIEEDLAHI